jgi:exopolyphosphatase/pppGpp-phosphohydrolase
MVSLKACIDLGTQTCLLLVVKSTGEILVDRSSMVSLGEGVKKLRVLNPQAQERTRVCLREYASVVASYGILAQDVVCVATSQARLASDASLFFQSLNLNILKLSCDYFFHPLQILMDFILNPNPILVLFVSSNFS